MTRVRLLGLPLVLLSAGFSIWWGFSLARFVAGGPLDFQGLYYGAQCLLQHHNPYNVSELETVYRADGGEHPTDPIQRRQTVTLYVNLPHTFFFTAPFTMFSLRTAQVLWLILTGSAFTLSGFLIWDLAARDAPILTGCLLFILLANSELFFLTGNSAGIVVSLCVVAAWCFLRDRFVTAGILCMAISLAIKPHDAGFVWLYFLLAGGVHRKRALQVLGVDVVLGLSGLLWVFLVAPHWMQGWRANMATLSLPGGLNNAGLPAVSFNIMGGVISLQTVFAVFRDDPRIYNPLTWLVCGAMLAVWSVRTLRTSFSRAGALLALAAIAPITMLVTYHRAYDAKLLLLTIPACAMLWARGGATRWIALALNTLGIWLTADFPLAIIMTMVRDMHISTATFSGRLLTIVLMRPAPLILLAMSIFYLRVYMRPAIRGICVESGKGIAAQYDSRIAQCS